MRVNCQATSLNQMLDCRRKMAQKGAIRRNQVQMPTLIRFVVFIGILAAIVYGSMFALTIFVDPEPREISQRIPSRDLFNN